jgi:adenylate cyclase
MDALKPLTTSSGEDLAESSELEPRSPAKVRKELQRILNSTHFDTSDRNRRFLAYVVDETLEGRGERIKAYNIATIVFGRDDSFDPQLDPVVRMEARRLRRSLERFYLVAGEISSVRITLPKGSYVPKFQSSIMMSPAVLPAFANAVGESSTIRGPSILISRFDAEDGEPVCENYGNGFVRQLAVGLSRFPEFTVFVSQPPMGIGPLGDPQRTASSQGVDFVLSGVTTLDTDMLGVKATLVHAQSGRVVWGGTFEQNTSAKGLHDVRDRIADQIVRILAGHERVIAGSAISIGASDTRDLTSYESLIHFARYQRSPRQDTFLAAREYLEKALAIDPGYSEAAALLSRIYSDGHRFAFASSESPGELRHRALQMALRAIELSPSSSRGYHAQGIALWFLGEVDASIAALQAALMLNPNATDVMSDLGLHYCLRGEWSNGVKLIHQSLAGGAVQSGIQRLGLSLNYFSNGQFDLALTEASCLSNLNITHCYVARAISLVRLGRREEAKEAIARILDIDPHYGRASLHEFGGNNLQPALAHEIRSALRDAGLVSALAVVR